MSARHKIVRSGFETAFERKVRLSKWALLFEQLWPRAWLLLGLGRAVHRRSRWPACGRGCRSCRTRSFSACSGWRLLAALRGAGAGALALARRGHPPRRGGVRHQASPGVLLRGHADAGRRRRPHGRAVARAPPAPGRPAAEAARRPALAAHRPLRSLRACARCCCSASSCCWSWSATAPPTGCARPSASARWPRERRRASMPG